MGQPTRLLLFDYDGPLVIPHPDSFSIIREAISLTIPNSDLLDWNRIFRESKGTTERAFLTRVAQELHLSTTRWESFFQRFYHTRSELVQSDNSRRNVLRFDDTYYYDDALRLIEQSKQELEPVKTIVGIVTGNPREVMKHRLPDVLGQHIDFMVCGDEGNSRKQLQTLALKRAKDYGFHPWQGQRELRIRNAFYFDDVARAVISGMEVGLQPIYVMRTPGGEFEIREISGPTPTEMADAMAPVIVEYADEQMTREKEGIPAFHNPHQRLEFFFTERDDPDPRIFLYAGLEGQIGAGMAWALTEKVTGPWARENMMMVTRLDDERLPRFLDPAVHRPLVEGNRHRRRNERI